MPGPPSVVFHPNDPGIIWDDILSNGNDVPPVVIDSCEEPVENADERVVKVNGTVRDGKKLASDAARTLSTHLLAAQLNEGNGACINQDVKDVVLYGEKLLEKINFDGKKTTAYLTAKSQLFRLRVAVGQVHRRVQQLRLRDAAAEAARPEFRGTKLI